MAYDTFMRAFSTPKEDIDNQMQEMVNEQFLVSSSYHTDIYQEIEFGTLEFKRIEARITHLIESATGLRVGDDFKKITFKDLKFKPALGSRYKFEDNIWLVYATDNTKSPTSSCYVRRCNNTMNMLDRYGNVHQEPCYIDYKPTKTSLGEYDNLSLPFTKQIMFCQLNDWTKDIGINNRFMFGSDVFKITDRIKFNRTKTFEEETLNTNRYCMDYDNLNEFDNLELGIADYKIPDWKVIVPVTVTGVPGSTGTLSVKTTLNDIEEDEKVNWYSSDEEIISIDMETGEYTLLKEGTASIIAKLDGNEYYYGETEVEVTNEPVEVFENIISPDVAYIPVTNTQVYEVFEYDNGETTDTEFTIESSDLSQQYYKIKLISGNKFSITNKKQNTNTLLKVTCTNNRDGSVVTKLIEMGGIF